MQATSTGDTILLRAGTTMDISTVVTLTATSTTGTLAVNDYVYCYDVATPPTTPDAGAGEGYIVRVDGNVYRVVVVSGTWTTNKAIFKDASNYTNAAARTFAHLLSNTADVHSRTSIVGVNASWAEDGTRAILDGANASASLLQLGNYYGLRNVSLTRATSHALSAPN
jgi:hypothetical protein